MREVEEGGTERLRIEADSGRGVTGRTLDMLSAVDRRPIRLRLDRDPAAGITTLDLTLQGGVPSLAARLRQIPGVRDVTVHRKAP